MSQDCESQIIKELDIMNTTVIEKAYDMIGNSGQSLAPETSAILTLLATPAHAAALGRRRRDLARHRDRDLCAHSAERLLRSGLPDAERGL